MTKRVILLGLLAALLIVAAILSSGCQSNGSVHSLPSRPITQNHGQGYSVAVEACSHPVYVNDLYLECWHND